MAAGGSACHCHAAQAFPFHRIHLRAWRTAALAVHWPFTTIIPGPQPNRTCVIKLSGCRSGARVIACDDVATANAKPTRAMSLIILFLPYKNTAGAAMSEKQSGCGVVPDFGGFPKIEARNSFPRQGAKRGSPAEPPLHPANSKTSICIKKIGDLCRSSQSAAQIPHFAVSGPSPEGEGNGAW